MNKKGSVLMITLWVLAILVIFALGLAHRASITLRLVRYQRDRLKATYLAKAGINKAISILEEDGKDPETANFDIIDECGVNLKGKLPKDIFSQEWKDKNESFKIGYESSEQEFIYGLKDEESRININGISNIDNRALLLELLKLKNVENYEALADTIFNWIDKDKEEEVIFKNQTLGRPEELLVILEYFSEKSGKNKKESRKIAQEVYNEIKDLITVYPDNININTASSEVLKVIARTVAKTNGKNEAAADSLIPKVMDFRNGNPFKAQETINATEIGDSQEEKEIFNLMKDYLTSGSNYFRISVVGEVNNLSKNITAIYNRRDQRLVYWHEN